MNNDQHLMWSSHNSFQLATGRTELYTVSTKQQRQQTASDRPRKRKRKRGEKKICPPARAGCDPYFSCYLGTKYYSGDHNNQDECG